MASITRGAAREKPGAVREALINVRRRRSYLIDPQTQFTITRQFLLVLIAASGLSVGNYHVIGVMLETERYDAFSAVLSIGYCAVMFLISATLLFLLCVFFSHRIAGPARKLSEALNAMAHGDLSVKMRLRDTDLLKELADAINATNRNLRGALSEVDRDLRRAHALAEGQPELAGCLARAEEKLAAFRLSTGAEVDPRAQHSASRSN